MFLPPVGMSFCVSSSSNPKCLSAVVTLAAMSSLSPVVAPVCSGRCSWGGEGDWERERASSREVTLSRTPSSVPCSPWMASKSSWGGCCSVLGGSWFQVAGAFFPHWPGMGPFAFVTMCGGHDDLCVSFFFVYVYPCESLDVSSYRDCTEIFGYNRLRNNTENFN